MSGEVLMPQLGETVAEGRILSWFKKPGDPVGLGDRLFEVETDKVTIDVEAVVAGRLDEIRVDSGATAKVGAVVAVIAAAGSATSQAAPAPQVAPAAVSAAPAPAAAPPAPLDPFAEVRTAPGRFGPARSGGLPLSPLARRLIVQNGLDGGELVAAAQARGARRITEKDVRAALAARPPATPAPPPATAATPAPAAPPVAPAPPVAAPAPVAAGEIVTLNTMRRRTGERLAEAWRTVPHVFQAIEVDFTSVGELRGRLKERFRAETGFALTFLPFIARATCLALRAFPQANARFDGKELHLSREINLGIAVDLDHAGLVVPVVRGAEDLTVPGLAKAIGRLVEKARAGRLGPDDLSGGTYSISNNGAFGTAFTAPIVNAPQVAILSTDAIRLRPAVVETPAGAFVAPRLTGFVGQSFDHRAFDGAYAAAFLSRLKSIIETRTWSEDFV